MKKEAQLCPQKVMRLVVRVSVKVGSIAILLAIIPLLIYGCEEQTDQPLKPFIKAQEKNIARQSPSEPLSTPKVEDLVQRMEMIYNYQVEGRRDPFKSLLLGLKEKKKTGLTPLQQRSLGELKVIGIVWSSQEYMAMIETPDGKGFLLKKGTLVGPEGGVVKKITENSIIIEEVYSDYYGKKRSKKTMLKLHAKEEEGG